jgi:hypothetical protein
MVEAYCKFIGRIGLVIDPITNIAKQGGHPFGNFVEGHSNILLGSAVLASPLPRLIKHPAVQLTDVIVAYDLFRLEASSERPGPRQQNVLALPFVEIEFGGEIWNQIGGLFGRERCLAVF